MEDLEDKLVSYKSEWKIHPSPVSLITLFFLLTGQFMEFDENDSGDIGKL